MGAKKPITFAHSKGAEVDQRGRPICQPELVVGSHLAD